MRVFRLMGLEQLAYGCLAAAMLGQAVAGCGQDHRGRIESSATIRVATDATFAPFSWTDSLSHDVVGFDTDLARQLFGELGYRVEIVDMPLEELVPALQSGRCDAVISAFSVTPERREQVLFSRPYFQTELVIVAAASDSSIRSVADLVGKKVGVERGSTGERRGERIFRAEVFRYAAVGHAMQALEQGELVAVINDRPSSELWIAGGAPARIVDGYLEREEYAAAFRRSDDWLQARFDSALSAFMAAPGFERLLSRYGLAAPGIRQPPAP